MSRVKGLVLELIDSLRSLPRIVTCHRSRDGECKQGKIIVPGELRGKMVYVVISELLDELERRVATLEATRAFLATLLNTRSDRKMFSLVTETWNPITGCHHNCIYCWARRLALTRLRNTQRYRDGFKPRLNEDEFKRRFNGGVVFVSDMGDMWGDWVPDEWIRRVLDHIRRFPNTYFLFLTKNPERYHDFIDEMPPNAILGATIETNRSEYFTAEHKPRISQAPLPRRRYEAMKKLDWPLKLISIEPILDFDLEVFVSWIRDINPFMVYVGYDNYNYRLPEPPLSKTLGLIQRLEEFTIVVKKTLRPAWYERGSPLASFNSEFKSDKPAVR